MLRSGGDLVVETLKAAGVDTVFGIISVHNIPIYDAIARQGGIRTIMARHEQAAISMADGYARATGKLGVAITSTGPGAANGMGAMLEAYWANSPVLHLAGNIETPYIGKEKGFLHEAKDQLTMLSTATKWSGRPSSTAEIPEIIAEAILQAMSGRQRPVAVDLPIDLQYFEADASIPEIMVEAPPTPDIALVRQAAQMLQQAERPLVWAGGGVISSDGAYELQTLAKTLGAGVLTSATGRGSMPEDDAFCIGNLSLEPKVQILLKEADVLLAIGTRFQGPNTINWKLPIPEKLIHIDIDPSEINRNYPATIGLVGDAREVMRSLIGMLGGGVPIHEDWEQRLQLQGSLGKVAQEANIGPEHVEIMETLRAGIREDAIMVKDATIPAYTWGNRLLPVYLPRTSMHSTSVAIGPGLPLALGAAIGQPDREVILIAGDGGFLLNIAELSTAAQYHLKVVFLVFNDRGYGILRNYQVNNFEGRHIAVDLQPVDFVAVAQGMGVPGRAVPTTKDFAEAIRWAISQSGPALLDIDMAGIAEMPVPYGGTSRQPAQPT